MYLSMNARLFAHLREKLGWNATNDLRRQLVLFLMDSWSFSSHSDAVRADRPSPHTSASCFGQGKQEGIQINSYADSLTPGIHFQKQLKRGQRSTQRGLFLTAPGYWSSSGLKDQGSEVNNSMRISRYLQICCNAVISQKVFYNA